MGARDRDWWRFGWSCYDFDLRCEWRFLVFSFSFFSFLTFFLSFFYVGDEILKHIKSLIRCFGKIKILKYILFQWYELDVFDAKFIHRMWCVYLCVFNFFFVSFSLSSWVPTWMETYRTTHRNNIHDFFSSILNLCGSCFDDVTGYRCRSASSWPAFGYISWKILQFVQEVSVGKSFWKISHESQWLQNWI